MPRLLSWLMLAAALLGCACAAFADPLAGLMSHGPYGGYGYLLNHPPGSDTLYLGAGASGLYRSLDRGLAWQRLPRAITGYSASAFVGDPNEGRTVYVGVPTGPTPMIRTIDGGDTWQAIGGELPSGFMVRRIVFDPNVPGRMYCAGGLYPTGSTGSHVLYRSEDHGDSWVAVPVDSVDTAGQVNKGLTLMSMLVSPTNPQRLYVSWAGSMVLRSDDGGASWTHLESPLFPSVDPYPNVRSVQFDGATDAELVMIAQRGVYKTWDAGAHWTRLDPTLPVTPALEDRRAWVAEPGDTLTKYLSFAYHGTYVTHDAGANWSVLCDSLFTTSTGRWSFGSAPREILSSDGRRAVVRSTDEFVSYQTLNQGVTGCTVVSLAWDPAGTKLYAGTAYCGAFVSDDGGMMWRSLAIPSSAPSAVRALAPSHVDPLRVFATMDGESSVYRTDDGGDTWSAHLVALDLASPYFLAVHPDTESTVWLAAESGLYLSRDAGLTWLGGRSRYPFAGVQTLRFSPQDPTVVFAGTRGGLWRSARNDSGWTKLMAKAVNVIAVHPARPEVILVGVTPTAQQAGIWISEDAGATWAPADIPSMNVYALAYDPADTSRVFAGSATRGVWASEDGGRTWAATALDSEYVRAIAFRPEPPPGAPRRAATAAFPAGIRFATDALGVLVPAATAAVEPPPAVATRGVAVRAWRDGAVCRVIVTLDRAASAGVVQVFDLSGRLVRELHRGALRDGPTALQWDGGSRRGGTASSGLYFVRVRTASGNATCRVVFLR